MDVEKQPGTLKPKRSKDDESFDISEDTSYAQQRCFYQSASSRLKKIRINRSQVKGGKGSINILCQN